ncbi:MAG: hypothetical protein U0822_17975 [Anaerolineae bacterium]
MRIPPRIALVWALVACLAVGWFARNALAAPSAADASSAAAPATLGPNLLSNPSFENGFDPAAIGVSSGSVGKGWHGWYIPAAPNEEPGYHFAPEFSPENIWKPSIMVHAGDLAQTMFNTYATHDAGVWQTVGGLTPGQTVEFTIWVRAWSSECDDPCVSPTKPCVAGDNNSSGNYQVAVGIDPTGADPRVPGNERQPIAPPASVVWTPFVQHYDEYFPLTIRTVAQADHVTVYTRGRAEWKVKYNFSFWDDARLAVVVDDTVTPAPSPTFYVTVTPPATSTPTATAPVATATATSAATATNPPRPQTNKVYLPLLQQAGEPPATPTPTATATAAPTNTPTATTVAPSLTPTATATPVETATSVPSAEPPTATPTATATSNPVTCGDIIVNGGFETDDAWQIQAAVPYPASIESSVAHSGQRALQLGPAGAADKESWSYAWQVVTIPINAQSAVLHYWVRAANGDSADRVEAIIYTSQGVPVQRLLDTPGTSDEWHEYTADVSAWAGTTIQVLFNAYNDGKGATLRAYVDDVGLDVCAAPSASAAVAQKALGSSLAILTPQQPARRDDNWPNVHFTWVTYSANQIGRSSKCAECDVEWSFLQNDGAPVDLAGWTVTTEKGDSFTFPSLVLQTGEGLRLHSRSGQILRTPGNYSPPGYHGPAVWDVFWGSTAGLLADPDQGQSGRLTITDPQGRQPSAKICWGPTQTNPGACPAP